VRDSAEGKDAMERVDAGEKLDAVDIGDAGDTLATVDNSTTSDTLDSPHSSSSLHASSIPKPLSLNSFNQNSFLQYLTLYIQRNRKRSAATLTADLQSASTGSFLQLIKLRKKQSNSAQQEGLLKLYKSFLESANFHSWLSRREFRARCQLRRVYLDHLSAFDFRKWIQSKHEVEIVDALLSLKAELVAISKAVGS
jgi:hypothetical protein